jgi:hypothetical protein
MDSYYQCSNCRATFSRPSSICPSCGVNLTSAPAGYIPRESQDVKDRRRAYQGQPRNIILFAIVMLSLITMGILYAIAIPWGTVMSIIAGIIAVWVLATIALTDFNESLSLVRSYVILFFLIFIYILIIFGQRPEEPLSSDEEENPIIFDIAATFDEVADTVWFGPGEIEAPDNHFDE